MIHVRDLPSHVQARARAQSGAKAPPPHVATRQVAASRARAATLTAVGDPAAGPLVLELPEPPSLNAMLDLAKQRTRRTRTGGWMKRALPVVYDQELEAYELRALATLRTQGIRPPADPWPRWVLVAAHFRLHSLRDPIELQASLKWPVDVLVRGGFVADDSSRELVATPSAPTQVIARADRGVTLMIAPA